MDFSKKYNEIKDQIVIGMSKVSRDHIETEEQRLEQKITSDINYENVHWTNVKCSSRGKIDNLSVREISNGKDKYSVEDSLFSYHYDGVTSCWQYGVCVEDKDCEVRNITVSKGGNKTSLSFKREKGSYQERGDSSDHGEVNTFRAKFKDREINVPADLDLTDINAIRYHLQDNKNIAYFLDKYVIVSPQEKETYRKYAEAQEQNANQTNSGLTSFRLKNKMLSR